jgi:hypothetical protein
MGFKRGIGSGSRVVRTTANGSGTTCIIEGETIYRPKLGENEYWCLLIEGRNPRLFKDPGRWFESNAREDGAVVKRVKLVFT